MLDLLSQWAEVLLRKKNVNKQLKSANFFHEKYKFYLSGTYYMVWAWGKAHHLENHPLMLTSISNIL